MSAQGPQDRLEKTARDAEVIRNKIVSLEKETKEELLIRAAVMDKVTAGGIMQAALDYLPQSREALPDDVLGEDRVKLMIRRTLRYLPDVVRDELLCFAGLRNKVTAAEIMDPPRAGGNEKEGNEGANEECLAYS